MDYPSGCGIRVEHGAGRFCREPRSVGGYDVAYKIATQDTNGALFALEQTIMRKGGPPRHLHYAQDEWFYVLEGEYIAEVGHERMHLKPGDSLFSPRKIPHAWAYIGDTPGRLLIAFQPAGTIEAFFNHLANTPDFKRDPQLFRDHGMEVVGPPLLLDGTLPDIAQRF
jgi:mannose-6-phosphate isomerase-like protein (cupin superfamily)